MDNNPKKARVLKEGEKVKLGTRIKDGISKAKRKILSARDEDYFKLAELVENSKVLYRTKTVFPFDFFPDELIIDRDKVAIIVHYFIASNRYQSILIKNISDVYVDNAMFFSTLYISDKYFADNPIKVEYLGKKDAIRARDIIQGLVICHEQDVDISGMTIEEVLPYLEEIGRATVK